MKLTSGSQGSAKFGLVIGLLISAAIVFWLIRSLDWPLLLVQLKRLHWFPVPLLVALFLLSFVMRAFRWRYLLPTNLQVSTGRLFNATILGVFTTFVLPLRAGEFVRPWVLSRWVRVSFPSAFASIVTERVFDVFGLLVLLGWCLWHIDQAPSLVIVGSRALGILALLILLAMIAAYLWGEKMKELSAALLGLVFREQNNPIKQKLLNIVGEFISGLRSISSFRELLAVLFWTMAIWMTGAVFYHVTIWALGENPPFIVGLTINVMIALAVAAPSAPGFIGTFQLGCVIALSGIFGFSKEFAIAYSLVSHAFQMLFIVFLGLFILQMEGMRFAELRSAGKKEASL